jgi:hypothetical protein
MRAIFVLLFTVIGATGGLAQRANVDWKYYGGATIGNDPEQCFFEAKGIVRPAENHVRVWTKCLSQKDLDAIDIEKDYNGTILENTAQKRAHGYLPPIALTETLDDDQITIAITYEESANVSGIRPTSRIFYELNCAERAVQELSLNFELDGKIFSRETPGSWKHAPPETNAARMLNILCRSP